MSNLLLALLLAPAAYVVRGFGTLRCGNQSLSSVCTKFSADESPRRELKKAHGRNASPGSNESRDTLISALGHYQAPWSIKEEGTYCFEGEEITYYAYSYGGACPSSLVDGQAVADGVSCCFDGRRGERSSRPTRSESVENNSNFLDARPGEHSLVFSNQAAAICLSPTDDWDEYVESGTIYGAAFEAANPGVG